MRTIERLLKVVSVAALAIKLEWIGAALAARLLKRAGDSVELLAYVCRVHVLRGTYGPEIALRCLDRVRQGNQAKGVSLCRGLLNFQLGRYDQAEDSLADVIDDDSGLASIIQHGTKQGRFRAANNGVLPETQLAARNVAIHARNGTVTLAACDSNYLPILELWLQRCDFSSVQGGIVIVAMDAATVQWCVERDVPTVAYFTPGIGRGKDNYGVYSPYMWLERTHLVYEILKLGVHCLLTDADAFWIRDPRPLLTATVGDIVASREKGMPRFIARRWGFVLCCGFILYRSTPTVIEWFPRYLDKVRYYLHDQVALNAILEQSGIVWESAATGLTYSRRLEGTPFVTALRHEEFSRSFTFGSYVRHKHLRGSISQRVDNCRQSLPAV